MDTQPLYGSRWQLVISGVLLTLWAAFLLMMALQP
jgi:hypothetical protein